MWTEIKSKAKMELLHILFMSSVSLTEGITNLKSDERREPTPRLIERLENVIRTFERYEFI